MPARRSGIFRADRQEHRAGTTLYQQSNRFTGLQFIGHRLERIQRFNGLVVSDLSWSGFSDSRLLDVVVDTNLVPEFSGEPPWSNNRIILGETFVGFDWRSLLFTDDSFLNLTLTTTHYIPQA